MTVYRPLASHSYSFPEPDLLNLLVEIYFFRHNNFWPLFHRPTFNKSVVDGLHAVNPEFAKIVLCICAVASQWSDDRRVLDNNQSNARHSAGWKWYDQVGFEKCLPFIGHSLNTLQLSFVSQPPRPGCL
jgi:hypothetical protein